LRAAEAKGGIFIQSGTILGERFEPMRFPKAWQRFHPASIPAVITDSRGRDKFDSRDPLWFG